jgi:hypothetical protein
MCRLSIEAPRKKVDSYRYTFHPELYTSDKDTCGKQEEERIPGRTEFAHLVLIAFNGKSFALAVDQDHSLQV